MTPETFDPILTSVAAALIGVSVDTIRKWERSGRLVAVRTSHGVRLFRRSDVLALARERKTRRMGKKGLESDDRS